MATDPGCPACGGPLRAWRSAPAAEPAEPPVALARCTRCGTGVTLGPPAHAALHESGDYAPGAPRLARLAAPVLRAFDRQRLALLRPGAPPPCTLLDAGAGRGRFVARAREAGYVAAGVEPSARGVSAARTVYGVDLQQVGLEDATGCFDAVTCWHVLEHVEDPGAAVRALRDRLAPGGTLLVGVPNLAGWQARVGGTSWYHLDLPRHRTHFTPAGLRALLSASDLDVVSVHHVLAEHNPFGMWQSLVSRLTHRPSYLYHLLKRNAPLRSPDLVTTVALLPTVPLAVAAELLAGACRRGGTVAVVARRA